MALFPKIWVIKGLILRNELIATIYFIQSALLAMLVHGCLHGRNSSEVLTRAYIHGFQYDENKDPELIQLVRDVLDNRQEQCGTPSGAANLNLINLCVVMIVFSMHFLDKTLRQSV